jgi:hypothetical protein
MKIILTCEPNSTSIPYLAYNPSSMVVPSSVPIFVSSSNDENEYENPPPPTHLPPNESIEQEPAPTPLFLNGSVQHEKQLVILYISVEHAHSFGEPILFWLKFHRIMIQTHLQNILAI